MNFRNIPKKYVFFFGLEVVVLLGIIFFFIVFLIRPHKQAHNTTTSPEKKTTSISPFSLPTIPQAKILPTSYHVFQTFNNCGPASLSMTLALYGIHVSQEELGQALRPYQVVNGDNDDKSVTLDELAEKAKDYGFIPYHRPNGSIQILKQFIAQGIPIITRTWLHKDEDIGHYRVVKGYDESIKSIIQDDSFQNKNLWYTYDDFNDIWKKYDYEYLVLIPKEKNEIAKQILGDNFDEKKAWQNAVESIQQEIKKDPFDIYNHFNLSVAYYHIGKYQDSANEYEKVASQLPFRTLWYQIEPIQSYYELGQYDKVFTLTDSILNNQNRAFSELYIIRGDIYKKQGNKEAAKSEYEKAVYYNKNLKEAKDALSSAS